MKDRKGTTVMKDAKISIRPTDIKEIVYKNAFSGKPGESMKMQVKTNVSIKLNPATPTMGFVLVKFEAADEGKTIEFQLETITAVVASTFIDNLDEVIKSRYMNLVLLAVNEKIRMVAANVGLNIPVPAITFNYGEGNTAATSDNVVTFHTDRKK